MRHGLVLVALLLPLSGCVVPPQPIGYGYGYPQPGYPVADDGYPGYAYNDGSPTMFVDGATVPLIFYGGGWGYWDGFHRWHGAPDRIGRDLALRHPGGVGYRPWGGGGREFGRPEGLRPEGFRSEGFRPGAEGFRPGGGRPGGFAPASNPGATGWQNRSAGGPPGGGFRPSAPAPVQRAAAPGWHPAAAAPERHRDDHH